MENAILVRSEGNANAELLEKEILELNDIFSKEGTPIYKEIRKSLEFGAVGVGTVIITIGISIATHVITKFIDKILDKAKSKKDVKIQINIMDSNIIFKLPEDKQKLLDYYKRDE